MADFVDPFAAPAQPQKPSFVDPFDTSADQGAWAAANRGATQGVTFGFGDEINALSQASGWKPEESGLGSLATGAYKYFTGDKEAEQRYNTAVARNRFINERAKAQHPYAYGAGEIAGSLPAMAVLPEAELAGIASPLGRGVLKGAQVGAEYGALSGAGEGTDAQSRLTGAGIGAGTGLIGGAAAPLVTAGIGKLARPVVNTIAGAINPERQASKAVAAALDADQQLIAQGKVKGMTEAQWLQAKAAGEPVTLTELGGPNTQSLLRSAANTSPEARGKIEKVISDRFETQSQRVAHDVRGLVNGGANAWKTGDQLLADYDAKRSPLYFNAFMQHGAQGMWDDTLEQITQAPAVQNAIRVANVTARNDAAMRGLTPMRASPFVFDDAGRMTLRTADDGSQMLPNLQYWDSVKKGLDKINTPESRQWAFILRNHLDSIVPEYGQARGFAANYFGEDNALQAGRKLAGKQVDPEVIRRTMAKMEPEERDLFREGYASDWADRVISNFRDSRDVTKAMFNSPNERARAEAVFGPQGMQALQTRMDLERIMDGARQAMGNSTTARQLIEAGLAGAGGAGLGAGIGGYEGGWHGALLGGLGGVHAGAGTGPGRAVGRMLMTGAQAGAQRLGQFVDRGTASRVADMLMSADPDKRRIGLAAAVKDRRISSALSQIANRLMLAGGFSAGHQFKRGGRADYHRARYNFVKKQGGGELSDDAPQPPPDVDWSKMNQPLGELKAPTYTPTEHISNAVHDALTGLGASPSVAGHLTEGLGGITNLTPLGVAGSAMDTLAAKARGDEPGVIEGMAGMIPGVGGKSRGVVRAGEEALAREGRSMIGHNKPPPDITGSMNPLDNVPVTFNGKEPRQFTPEDWEAFGKEHGVDNLGPLSPLEKVQDKNGKTFEVPGGTEGKWTYYDLLHMKANPINPAEMDRGLHTEMQRKLGRTMTPDNLSDADVWNGLVFGMTSPNNPLFPNQLAMSRLRLRDPQMLDDLASMIPWKPGDKVPNQARLAVSDQIARRFGLASAEKGGLGVRGSTDYSRIGELAQMFKQDPSFFRKQPDESWGQAVERISSQVPGLSMKTGSFGTVWQDPATAAISAIDRHMARELQAQGGLFASNAEEKAWQQRGINLWNTRNPDDAVKTWKGLTKKSGSDGFIGEMLLDHVGNAATPKFRLAKGNINPDLPEHLQNANWVREPAQVYKMGQAYKRALDINQQLADKSGLNLFMSQWMEWDRIRQRFEPHENMFPGLTKTPAMTVDQMRAVDDAHRATGHKTYTKTEEAKLPPTRPFGGSPSQMGYLGLGSLGALPAMKWWNDSAD